MSPPSNPPSTASMRPGDGLTHPETESLAQTLLRGRETLAKLPLPPDLQSRVLSAAVAGTAARKEAVQLSPTAALMAHGRVLLTSLPLRWRYLRAFARPHLASPRSKPGISRPAWAAGVASMSAAACLIALLAPLPSGSGLGSGLDRSGGTSLAANGVAPSAQFVALPGMAEAASAVDQPLWMVPVELPKAQLVSYGLPFDPTNPAQRVRAQVLVNGQGQAVAVRLEALD